MKGAVESVILAASDFEKEKKNEPAHRQQSPPSGEAHDGPVSPVTSRFEFTEYEGFHADQQCQ